MKKDRLNLPTALLLPNLGQLEWLPKNPRQWTQDDIDRTAKSIREDEDFLEDRPLLVTPQGKKWIIFAGNLRRTAAAQAGVKTLPCVVYLPETDEDYDTIKRRAMKDNGSFGSWDYDELANSWDDLPLEDFGVPAWGEQTGQDGEIEPNNTTEDNFDEENGEISVICKRGDIWQLGDHKLMCGDSIDIEEVKKLMGGVKLTSY